MACSPIMGAGEAGKVVIRNIPLPDIKPDQVLVKVEAAAANPTDCEPFDKHFNALKTHSETECKLPDTILQKATFWDVILQERSCAWALPWMLPA